MTALLVGVRNAAEAELAGAGGADLLDWEGPSEDLPAVRRRWAGLLPISQAMADPTAAASSVDHPRIAWPAAAAAKVTPGTIGVLTDPATALEAVGSAAAAGFAGLLLDTTGTGRLLDRAGVDTLAAFTTACRAAGLRAGLGGSLEAPDIPRLRLVRPDILRVSGAVRRGGQFDAEALAIVRALLPRGPDADVAQPEPVAPTDTIFVHNHVVAVSIGAYGRERTERQRVRFDVDVEVRRLPRATRDMRDVFSYDLVLDAIRLLVGRGHVLFVETLAEDLAAAVLAHPRVDAVSVRAQKLDVVPGTLGVALRRTRADIGVLP